ncbi:hypothetical protein, partial [Mesorhizobium sp. B2-5-3]|uniref:hypothetical protein n=2 Tax=Mesorhizobium TaxID=68287 RepID=UPI0032B1E482
NRFDAKTEADRSCATKPDNLISYRQAGGRRCLHACEKARGRSPKQKRTENETIPPSARHRADIIEADTAHRNGGVRDMMSAVEFHDNRDAGDMPARLRAADVQAPSMIGQPAGPFEVHADTGPSLRDALVTGLLVIYPTVATVVAIVAGLFLGSANGA